MRKVSFLALVPLFLLPALVFTICLVKFGIDAPYIDDFHLYNFLYRFDQTGDPRWFLTQTNEHRTAFARVVVWTMERLTGQVNLVWQMGFSVFTLGLLMWLLARTFRTLGLAWTWFAPVPLLLFQIQGWSNYFWGFCAISNVAVVGFVALSLYLVRGRGWRFFTSIPVGFLATFTMGSGMLVFLAGTLVLLLQRRRGALVWWLSAGAFSATLYFYQFKSPPRTWLSEQVRGALPNWLTYLGNFADFTDNLSEAFLPVCFLTGLALVGLVGWRLWREEIVGVRQMPRATLLFLTGLLTYLAGTGVLVVLNRTSMIENRYKINSLLFLIAAYLLVVPLVRHWAAHRWAWVIPTGVAGLFFGYSYLHYLPDVVNFRQEVLGDFNTRANGGTGPDDPFYERIQYLQKKGTYHLPPAYDRVFEPLHRLKPEPATSLNQHFPGLHLTNNAGQITLSDSSQVWSNDPDEGLWLVLRSDTAQFVWRAGRSPAGIGSFLKGGRLLQPGAEAEVYACWLRPARYQTYVYRSGRNPKLVEANLTLPGRAVVSVNWLD